MNKKEYMEILIDYLSQNVSIDEKYEILRDVEEMVEDGKLSGRTEEEVVMQLGSPKRLVSELKGEEIFFDKESDDKNEDIKNLNITDINMDKIKEKTKNRLNFVKEKISEKRGIGVFLMLKCIFSVCINLFGTLMIIPVQIGIVTFLSACIVFTGFGITTALLLSKVSLSLTFACIFAILVIIGTALVFADLFRVSVGFIKILFNNIKRNFIKEEGVKYE